MSTHALTNTLANGFAGTSTEIRVVCVGSGQYADQGKAASPEAIA